MTTHAAGTSARSSARRAARLVLRGALLAGAASLLAPPTAAQDGVRSAASAPFVNFESHATRPLLLAPDGERLYVLNTPDHRVEIWATNVDGDGVPQLAFHGAIFTGLEPVAMALDPGDPNLLYVANLLSDSVSVVDLARRSVLATIAVGDEPFDLGVIGDRLVVTTARSSHAPDPVDPGAFTDNAVVIVQKHAPHDVLARLELPAHRPGALAVVDGLAQVVALNSGNRTTALDAFQAATLGLDQTDLDAFDTPFTASPLLTIPDFFTSAWINTSFGIPLAGWSVPVTGRIVFDHEYPSLVPQLADADLFAVDPLGLTTVGTPVTGVGTTLLAIARNPATGELWIANTDADNRRRFEPELRGRAVSNRITVVGGGGVREVLELAPPRTRVEHAQPVSLAFFAPAAPAEGAPAPALAYVGTLGDGTVTVLDAHGGALVDELDVGPLPTGLAVDAARGLLYVFTRGDLTLRARDIGAGHAPVGRPARLSYDPEPLAVSVGRGHLYDARADSGAGNGNMSCATCHVSGHMDQLAWDLGDPQGGFGYFYPDAMTGVLGLGGAKLALKKSLMTHPLKGPMTTQSLRGLIDDTAKPLHWRGDRRFFQMFRGAFSGLLGGSGLGAAQMQEFAAFVRSLNYPPNPLQPKDREYAGAAAHGRDLFGMNPAVPGKEYNPGIPGNVTCIDCHAGDFAGQTDFTGTQGTVNFDGESQLFNTAQLRGAYEKEFRHLTGFGVLHDGTIADIQAFLDFVPPVGGAAFPALTANERSSVTAFVRAWDTGTAPLVGAQFTASLATWADGLYDWLDLAEIQSVPPLGNVDLIGKGHVLLGDGTTFPFGLTYAEAPGTGTWMYRLDQGSHVTRGTLVAAIASGQIRVTFTVVPPGTGLRLGIDRDEDGLLDGLERQAGTSPDAPDTDRDGFDDALELALGGDPLVPQPALPGDVAPPAITAALARDVFADTATLHVECGEPARVQLELGLAPDELTLANVSGDGLRRVHDLVLDALPAGTLLHFRATASDQAGNEASATGSFTTAPPLFHVDDITLVASGRGASITLTATARIVDQAGDPVVDLPVRGLWAGNLAGADFFPVQRTDADGVATFVVGPAALPPGPRTFGVAYVGLNESSDPFFLGAGGDDPAFFYNGSANAVNSRTISLP